MKLESFDLIIYPVIFLIGVGVIMILSSTTTLGLQQGDVYYYFKREILYLVIGIAAMLFAAQFNYHRYPQYLPWILGGTFALLIIVFLPAVGVYRGGASRWLSLGVFTIQPSEIAKLATVLYLSHALVNKGEKIRDLVRGVIPVMMVVLGFAVLIMQQPDMGTTLVILASMMAMIVSAGMRRSHIVMLLGIGVSALAALAITAPYRLRRLMTFRDPWADPLGAGFHIIQSLIAVGSGGVLGVGLGASRQKYFYLPQQYTDFIFAIICEETGLIGASIVVAAFAFLAFRGMVIALRAPDDLGRYMAVGIVAWIVVQAFINVSVVIGLIPTTGIPLPLISYGGTAMIVTLYAIGILLNIARDTRLS